MRHLRCNLPRWRYCRGIILHKTIILQSLRELESIRSFKSRDALRLIMYIFSCGEKFKINLKAPEREPLSVIREWLL